MNKLLNPKIIYPVISILFIALIGLLFFYAIKFFTIQINGAFEVDQQKIEAGLGKIDMEKYNRIAPRLGIDPSKP